MADYLLTDAAKDQLEEILLQSAKAFGSDAAGRYALLITTSFEFIGANPELPGSTSISRLPGIRAYAIRLSRLKIEPSLRVGSPRHLVIYRVRTGSAVTIFGLVHDRMVLSRAARKLARKSMDP